MSQRTTIIRIPDDRLYVVTPLTPWMKCRKSIGMSKSLIIDNYLTGIHVTNPSLNPEEDPDIVVPDTIATGVCPPGPLLPVSA